MTDNTDKPARRHLFDISERSSLPRERALQSGLKSLSDPEIMAILLGTGTKGKNVLDLANEIMLAHGGHLSELANLSVNDITARYSGIGQSKALTLLAALELGRRAALDAAQLQAQRVAVRRSEDSYNLMRNRLQHLDHEEFWIMLLNNGLKRITDIRINEGATTFTVVEVKKIIRHMIEHNANHVILFHNHPSGQLNPSAADDQLTQKISEAARIFDFKVVDHIIVTPSAYFSYADNGRM